MNLMALSLIFLSAAVISVPISKKLGLGSVLGYLLAGIAIGPWGMKLVTEVSQLLAFSEIGVVLLLFIIGLELEPKRLWSLRVPIFIQGGVQVLGCFALTVLASLAFGRQLDWALVAGMGFALSSTAIVVQILQEKNLLKTQAGQSAFSILLFQDIAVIAMMALLPLLAPEKLAESSHGWWGVAKIFGVFVAIVFGGRFLTRPLLRFVAKANMREIFTSFSLLLVLGTAALMHSLEISMALGAFMAGVLLADSEYRHAIETDIEPFKGLLLGLFFISVGMSLDFSSVMERPASVALIVLSILAIKILVHFAIAKGFKIPKTEIPFFAIVLSQVGEFAFVLFGAAQGFGILDASESGLLMTSAALSMLSTPLFVLIYDRFVAPILINQQKPEADVIEDDSNPVIIAGFGRFGQIVGRFLYANGLSATVLDFEPDQVETLRKFGFKIYYGDATRQDLMEAAGIARAKILVIAIDDPEDSIELVDMVQKEHPHIKIYARARNIRHYYSLLDRKVECIEREMFEGSLKMGIEVLKAMGCPAHQAWRMANHFRVHNVDSVHALHAERDDQAAVMTKAKQARNDLEKMMAEDTTIHEAQSGGWD